VSSARVPDAVHLHIGVPKSGTTYIQETIWTNLDRLRDLGVTMAANAYVDHTRAAADHTPGAAGGR